MYAAMIPTYNEKENIESLVCEIFHVCKGFDVKIVIVDDNSPDGTGKTAERLKKKYPGKIYVIHRKERGRGTAGITGFKKCLEIGTEYIVEMDADFSHDPKYLPIFFKEIEKYDVVVGSRFIKGGSFPNRSLMRQLFTSINNLYTGLILGTNIKDIGGGFKCYRHKALKSLDFDSFVSNGYTIGAETLYLLNKKGFKIKEIPITFPDRRFGKSKMGFKIMLNYVFTIMKIRLRNW